MPVRPGAVQRDTQQRRAIRKVLVEAAGPMGPEEILREAQRLVPALGIATVYRNLKTLVEEGWLEVVELPGGPARYEVEERPHHHHFLCKGCGQAFDIHRCPPAIESLAPAGFRVEGHEIVLHGYCPGCPPRP